MSHRIKKANRPRAPIVGVDGGMDAIVAIAQCVLRRKRLNCQARDLAHRVHKAKSYEHALAIVQEYVTPVSWR